MKLLSLDGGVGVSSEKEGKKQGAESIYAVQITAEEKEKNNTFFWLAQLLNFWGY